MTPRDAFPGYDDPVNIEGEPEDVISVLLGPEPEEICDEKGEEDSE